MNEAELSELWGRVMRMSKIEVAVWIRSNPHEATEIVWGIIGKTKQIMETLQLYGGNMA